MDKVKSNKNLQYVYWDNGKKVTVIEEFPETDYNDLECLIDTSTFNFSAINMRDRYYEGEGKDVKTFADVLELCLEHKIIADEVIIEDVKNRFDNDELSNEEIANIISSLKFENFVIKPVWAISHSGVHFSLGSFNDTWDSGLAGYIWSDTLTEEELKRDFEIYSDFNEGYYKTYHIKNYCCEEGWHVYDDYWNCFKDFENAWNNLDFTITDIVDKPENSLYNETRNQEITNDQIVDYLNSLG